MKEFVVLFPHQLFAAHPLLEKGHPVWMVEEFLFFRQYPFHKQKIAFHRASMQAYAAMLRNRDLEVRYIEAQEDIADVRKLFAHLAEEEIAAVHYIDPVDDWLATRVREGSRQCEITVHQYETSLFLNTSDELAAFFGKDKERYFHHDWYVAQRKSTGILIEGDDAPVGGQWSFDADNRERFPADRKPPSVNFPEPDGHYRDAVAYVETHFQDSPGELTEQPLYPWDHHGARAWLEQFLAVRFADFGPYEDAIVKDAGILHHSVLTPQLNTGLLTPKEVVEAALDHAASNDIPINSLEGFIRQVIGWREFIRGMYVFHGGRQRTTNFWGFERKIPAAFYEGTTGIEPVDHTIRKVLDTGYCHHIERLMVLGNFMLLCEFDPDEVYRWFMELFIDAYDWVMVPNVYGMSQFADGGLMATKPYLSGSNYIRKMSDYPKGDWQQVWDGLFWRFMHVHRDFFSGNPRLGMLLGTWDRMSEEKQQGHLDAAGQFLNGLAG
ncbi:MAG: cryptochrome/photolyase family protein [Saprospiraceae bacterium]|nr:cryptochrome/photolyase family protein [Saprospiraceae bacterium]